MAGPSQKMDFHDNTFMNCSINSTQNQNVPISKRIDGLRYNLSDVPEHEIIGRDEDSVKILDMLKEKKRVVVTGCGGIGKTTLATFCTRNGQNNFPNAAFLSAEDEKSFKLYTEGLAVKLGIKYTDKLLIGDIFQEIFHLYENVPLLLILDNLDKFEVIKPMFNLSLSYTQLYILATSQNRGFKQKFEEYELGFLDNDQSKMLIKSILGENFIEILLTNDEINELIDELCEKFDGHPLGLAHASAHIRQSVTDACDFGDAEIDAALYSECIRKYLEDFGNPKDESFPDFFETTNNKSVFKAIQLNVEKVIGNPIKICTTAKLLTILSYLRHDFITKDMFFIIFGKKEAKTAMINLKKLSIITDSSNDSKLINIHRTTQSVVKILLLDFKNVSYKALLYCPFDNYYGDINKLALNESEINELEMCGVMSRDEIDEIVENAFDFFEDNKKQSFEMLQRAGCKELENENWPLSHKFLLSSSWDSLSSSRCGIVKEVLKIIGNLEEKSKTDITLLHVVLTKYDSKNLLNFLIEEGLSPMAMTVDKIIPLHVASSGIVDEDVFEILFDSMSTAPKNSEGDTVLHYLAKFYDPIDDDILPRIIGRKVNKEIQNNLGDYPIHTAVRFNNFYAVKRIFPKIPGFDINKKNRQGDTPLHIAIRSAVTDINPNQQEDTSFHLLLRSALKIEVPIIKKEISRILRAILIQNPSMDIRNDEGETVIDIAKKYNQENLFDSLIRQLKDNPFLNLRWDEENKRFEEKEEGIADLGLDLFFDVDLDLLAYRMMVSDFDPSHLTEVLSSFPRCPPLEEDP